MRELVRDVRTDVAYEVPDQVGDDIDVRWIFCLITAHTNTEMECGGAFGFWVPWF